MSKRGQTAVFIIVAVVIVVGGLLVFMFYPEISSFLGAELVPHTYLKSCVEDSVRTNVQMLADQGGYSDPEGYVMYQNNNVKYLCYNAQYYMPCQVQQAMIKEHFEEELNALVKERAEQCVVSMKAEYESRGYDVSAASTVDANIEIIPEKIVVRVDAPMTVTKETTQTFQDFNVELRSEMYNLLMIATSIIDYESTYGDAETSLYVQYYPNLRIEKMKLGDGSTVYTLEDVTTEERFTFASRSLAWPPGYGLDNG